MRTLLLRQAALSAGQSVLDRLTRRDAAQALDLSEQAAAWRVVAGIDEAGIDADAIDGPPVRYSAAASLVEALYRGLADNSVGRLIENLLRADLVLCDDLGFAPLDDVGAQLLFRFVAAAHERRSLGVASHWPFESWGCFLPEQTTAVALLNRLLHPRVVAVTSGDSYRMKEARLRGGGTTTMP